MSGARLLARDSFLGQVRHPLSTPSFRKSVTGATEFVAQQGHPPPFLCQCTSSTYLIRPEVIIKTIKNFVLWYSVWGMRGWSVLGSVSLMGSGVFGWSLLMAR